MAAICKGCHHLREITSDNAQARETYMACGYEPVIPAVLGAIHWKLTEGGRFLSRKMLDAGYPAECPVFATHQDPGSSSDMQGE